MMKGSRIILIASAVLMLSGCDFRNDLFDTHIKIDKEGKEAINTVQEQLDKVRETIPDLEELEQSLQSYLSTLEAREEELSEAIEEADSKLASVERNATKDINSSNNTLSSEIKSFRLSMQNQLESLENTVSDLQQTDDDLNRKIDDLKGYVGSEANKLTSWAQRSFMTLTQYNSICNSISSAKVSLETANKRMEELSASMVKAFETDFPAKMEGLESSLLDQVAEVAQTIVPLVQKAEEELKAEYGKYFSDELAKYEESMKGWVSELLDGYYTMAELDARIDQLEDELDAELDNNETYIRNLTSDLQTRISKEVEDYATFIANYRKTATTIANLQASNQKLLDDFAENADSIAINAQAISANADAIARQEEEIGSLSDRIGRNTTLLSRTSTMIAQMAIAYGVFEARVDNFGQELVDQAKLVAENAESLANNAELIARNVVLMDSCAIAISNNADAIAELDTRVSSLAEEMEAEYMAAIEAAIAEHEGVIADSIKMALEEVDDREKELYRDWNRTCRSLKNEVKTLTTKINSITTDFDSQFEELEQGLSDLYARIQSVSWIPT